MDRFVLEADKRELSSKGHLNSLRQEGLVPAILHRKGEDSVPVTVNGLAFKKMLHTDAGLNIIFNLKVGSDSFLARVEDIQYDVLRDGIYTHIDFGSISLTEKIEVNVPVTLEGQDDRENDGGVVTQPLYELVVLSLPDAIPGHLTANISKLTIGDSMHAKDITLPEGCELITDPDESVVSVTAPRVEEEAEADETEEGVEAGEEESVEPELVEKE